MRFLIILMDFQHAPPPGDKPVNYHAGERVSEDDDTAAYFCAAGWAKDEAGEIPTGEPNKGEVRLNVHAVGHKHSTTTAGS